MGMGGSAIAGDLVAAYVQPFCKVPVMISREYDLPGWVDSSHTLIIASSHSGSTEETLTAVSQAIKAGTPLIASTTGGELTSICKSANRPVLPFSHHGQPRAAVGFSFANSLAILAHHQLIPDPGHDIHSAVSSMKAQQVWIGPSAPVHQNPAKRLAGQMVGRSVTIMGSGYLAPLARRWKGQFNELAKVWSGYDVLPEACHNTIAGSIFPEDAIQSTFVLFLNSEMDHPRNAKRSQLLQKHLMLQGFGTDSLTVRGDSPMELIWNGLNYGDFVSYYLALGYGIDPTPIEAIQGFKKELGEFRKN
jgi:glucose/mannose-6-phosphate isomerase